MMTALKNTTLDNMRQATIKDGVIDENVTIPANTNAFSVGDVAVANGRTITVNGIWKIL